MHVPHYVLLAIGLVLIAVGIAAGGYVWQTPRNYGSPRWPLLCLFLGILLRGVALCLQFRGHLAPSTAVGILSNGILWFAGGAVATQWFHESPREAERKARTLSYSGAEAIEPEQRRTAHR